MSYCQEVGYRGSLSSSSSSSSVLEYIDYKASHQTAGRSGQLDFDLTNMSHILRELQLYCEVITIIYECRRPKFYMEANQQW